MTDHVITLRISGVLAMVTDGQRIFSVWGNTVLEALQNLFDSAPSLRTHILDESGSVRQHILIYADDTDIRWTGGLATETSKCRELMVIQAVSGG